MSIMGIYLAAGSSKRFGSNKLNQNIAGKPLGSLALKTALQSELDSIIVVSKKEDRLEWFPDIPLSKRIIHAHAPDDSSGQSDTIKSGVETALELQAEAVLIMLADQPLISTRSINNIIINYRDRTRNQIPFISSMHKGLPRPPTLFPSHMFNTLLQLDGDTGARHIIRNKKWTDQAVFLNNPDPNQFLDVDTKKHVWKLTEKIKF